ncbi:hypothetical protein MGWOODY_Tha476 [hydrothermal vent metagenome]|uniref:Uncharacterized protein n=1 Tax=hydrothermal vent metagenome TaxID=652676 RepID=A0A160TA26_9ZZZZ
MLNCLHHSPLFKRLNVKKAADHNGLFSIKQPVYGHYNPLKNCA